MHQSLCGRCIMASQHVVDWLGFLVGSNCGPAMYTSIRQMLAAYADSTWRPVRYGAWRGFRAESGSLGTATVMTSCDNHMTSPSNIILFHLLIHISGPTAVRFFFVFFLCWLCTQFVTCMLGALFLWCVGGSGCAYWDATVGLQTLQEEGM